MQKQHFLGVESQMREAECPNCGTVHDMASPVDSDATPKPGDASICIMCGHLSVFTDDFQMMQRLIGTPATSVLS